MGILAKVTFDKDSGKVKYIQETPHDIEIIKQLKKFVESHKGVIAYKYFMDEEEVNFNKKLPTYYRMIMLQPLLEKMSGEYGCTTVYEVDAILSTWWLKIKKTKSDGTTYDITMRIEAVSFAAQIEFIAKVANMAITKYQIKFPNANEVDSMNK